MPHLCDLLNTALDPTRLTAAALVSTTGAIVVSASRSTKSKDRTAIIMASLATAMWEGAATPGERTDQRLGNVYMEPIPRRQTGVQGAQEPESLFLLVLSCPVEGGWDLLKQRGHVLATHFGNVFANYTEKMAYSPPAPKPPGSPKKGRP